MKTVTATATYTLGFRNPEFEDYTLLSYDEARTAFYEEVQQSISDAGSDGYDLDWDGEYDPVEFEKLPLADQEQRTMDAHQRGIDQATQECFSRLWAELQRDGEVKLPDGTHMTFTVEQEDDDE